MAPQQTLDCCQFAIDIWLLQGGWAAFPASAALQDLSGWGRRRLQAVCRAQGLYAGGSKEELEDRLNQAVVPGRRVEVHFPAQAAWRKGIIVRVLVQGFEVQYDDNGNTCAHGLEEMFSFVGSSDDGQGSVREGSASSSQGDDRMLGKRIEVLWRLEHRRRLVSLWWPATVGRPTGRTDPLGRSYHDIFYDALPEYGFNDVEEAVACFTDARTICVEADGMEMEWRVRQREPEDTREDSSPEVLSDVELYVGGVDDISAGMADMGLGGAGAPQESRAPRKRALIIGCSYRVSSQEPQSTLSSTDDMHRLLLERFHVPGDNIMLLTDAHSDTLLLPTRRNILEGLKWLMKDVQGGDSLFLYFSGRGGSQPSPAGSEGWGRQAICPCDYDRAGMITSAKIHDEVVRPLPKSTTLHALIDSSHSGTFMNLPYKALLKRGKFHGWEEDYPGQSWQTTAGGLAVQFSTARQDHFAAGESMGRGGRSSSGEACGAATYAFQQAIERHKEGWGSGIRYSDLLEAMSDALRGSSFWDQEPQMWATAQLGPTQPDLQLQIGGG